ncbi:MAG: V-type ATP synthase subunit I, partial [Oscillibacter sp.]|nr:V-type ATP synthase subunit I [Oscillibacter sp.]
KLHVIAMADRREELLKGLLHLGCVQISEPDGTLEDPEWARLFRRDSSALSERKTEIVDVNTALDAVKNYAGLKDGMFIKRHPISEAEFMGRGTVETARSACEAVRASLGRLTQAQNEESRLASRIAGLQPWKTMDVPLEMTGTANVVTRAGVCPGQTDVGAIRAALDASDAAAELYEISEDKLQKYLFLIVHRGDEEKVQEILRPFGFSAVTFQGLTGTAAENIDALQSRLEEAQKIQTDAAAEIAANADNREALRVYADRLKTEAAKEENGERLLTDDTVLYFEGWAPAEKEAQVRAFLDGLGCAWEMSDPTEDDTPDVPVQLKNSWLTRPLNMVTEMYSLPSYTNVDPNPLMAPFFILFYGIMMADMGYGLLMFLLGLIVTKKYHPKGTAGNLFGLLTLCGVSTFIMGALTGGFFGDFIPQIVRLTTGKEIALPALFTPLDDTLMILIGAMALGFVQIVTGMAISFVQKLKNGQVLDAIFEEVTWWLVFAGLALMVLNVTKIVLWIGLAMVVIGPIVTQKGMGKITGIFSSLYNHVTGFFGDILSYSRLMALMLAGSVIAQVFNTLGAIP